MSNVTLGPGGAPVDSLALVAVDGVTIVGDGAGVPLSATSDVAAANVENDAGSLSFSSQTGFASMNLVGAGIVNLILAEVPADVSRIIPIVTAGAHEEAITFPALMWRADVGVSGDIVVRTFDSSGTLSNQNFFIRISLANANP